MIAKILTLPKKQRGGSLSIGSNITAKRYEADNVVNFGEVNSTDLLGYGLSTTTVSALMGNSKKIARQRETIYQQWQIMESDPLCSSAVSLLVTAALGGHETTGDTIFIEKTPLAHDDKQLAKYAEEITNDLSGLFNACSYQLAYIGCVFGDSYARIYSEENTGVTDLYIDELVRPPLIQPLERGSKTVGYWVYGGDNYRPESLDVRQMARLKMPRHQWIPQPSVQEKSRRVSLAEDNVQELPITPSMVGGSLLYAAEEPYGKLAASLLGIVGQRWLDSIDERVVSAEMANMTKDQQDLFKTNIMNMLSRSKTHAENVVKSNEPMLSRLWHFLPTFNEKQKVILESVQSARSGTITIDDVLLHARMTANAIGVDLSAIGFADLVAGSSFGDGGLFRVTAQIAERSRTIRASLTHCFDHIIDIHTLKKYGFVFAKEKRPVAVNFYGSISALEAERSRSIAEKANAALVLVQGWQMVKDMGGF